MASKVMPGPRPEESKEFPLSKTYQTTQLFTPRQLDRITVDNSQYQYFVKKKSSTPQDVGQRRCAKMGGTNTFVQHDIPGNQMYSLTALKLSGTRPWDQIVDPPLKSDTIIEKEVHLPFSRSHPLTSHTPNFSVFPDTSVPAVLVQKPSSESLKGRAVIRPKTAKVQEVTQQSHKLVKIQEPAKGQESGVDQKTLNANNVCQVNSGTQTLSDGAVRSPQPYEPYYVIQKAMEGLRIERKHVGSSPGIPVLVENPMLWDYPRSKHKRTQTYPGPKVQYSRRPATSPHYNTLSPHFNLTPTRTPLSASPTPYTPYTPGTRTITPHTQKALESIQMILTRSTAHKEHFPQYHPSFQPTNALDYSFRSRQSQRPWTTDSRGKYSSIPLFSLIQSPSDASEEKDNEEEEESSEVTNKMDNSRGNRVKYQDKSIGEEKLKEISTDVTQSEDYTVIRKEGVEMTDVGTQTEDEYFLEESKMLPQEITNTPSFGPIDVLTAKLYKLPLIDKSSAIPKQKECSARIGETVKSPTCSSPSRSISQKLYQLSAENNQESKPRSGARSETYTPRTIESTRKFMRLYQGFSRSEILNRFNKQYEEVVPDLRQYSIQKGKRHFIHGSHAYYYH